jgi:hypothetical protein
MLSIGIGIAAGMLVFLVAHGVSGLLLLIQQRELLGDVTGILGDLDTPPPGDLRTARQAIQALDSQYQQISVLAGLAAGTISAIWIYLRLERHDHVELP